MQVIRPNSSLSWGASSDIRRVLIQKLLQNTFPNRSRILIQTLPQNTFSNRSPILIQKLPPLSLRSFTVLTLILEIVHSPIPLPSDPFQPYSLFTALIATLGQSFTVLSLRSYLRSLLSRERDMNFILLHILHK